MLRAMSRAESDFDRAVEEDIFASDPVSLTTPVQDVKNASSETNGLRKRNVEGVKNGAEVKQSKDRKSRVVPASKKSWEIPRKVFHSSIGFMALYCYVSGASLDNVVRNLSVFLGIVVTADVIRLNNTSFERTYEKVLGFLMRESEKEKVNGVVWYLIGVIGSLRLFPEDIAVASVMILSWCDTSATTFGRLFGRYTPALPNPPFASRKSTAGFIAAVASGALTSYLFWCTPIALSHTRATGISWSGSGHSHPAIFGTDRVAGALSTGWQGWRTGFRGQSGNGLLPTASGLAAQYLGKTSIAKGKLGSDAVARHSDVPGMPWWLWNLSCGLIAGVAEGLELGGIDDNLSLPLLSGLGMWSVLYGWGRLATIYTRWTS